MSISSYKIPGLGIVKVCTGQADGKTWFCMSDLCAVLDVSSYSVSLTFAVKRADLTQIQPEGGGRRQNYVSFEGTRTVFDLLRDKFDTSDSHLEEVESWIRDIHVKNGGSVSEDAKPVEMKPLFNEVFSSLSLNAEKVILGTILVHPEFYPLVSFGRAYGYRIFQNEVNKKVHGYVQELYCNLMTVSPSLLVEFLRVKGVLDEIGGEDYLRSLASSAVSDVVSFYRTYSLLVCNLAYGMVKTSHNRMVDGIDSACGIAGVFEALEIEDDAIVSISKTLVVFEHFISRNASLTSEQKSMILQGWPHERLLKSFNRTAVDLLLSKDENPNVEGFLPFKRSAD